ncbi:MAG: peptide chain release factor-like protein [Myxococcales bacterium]|nr:MAG: peptide chain release factor-like protein [Myxococcales bacterium]
MPRYATDRATLEGECDIEFVKGSGPGGQHRNKRETGVRLVHRPSGVTIFSTERRSQQDNLDAAFERLIRRLKRLNYVPKPRRPTKPTRGAIEKRLESKRTSAVKKRQRRKPGMEE